MIFIQLPELFFIADKSLTLDEKERQLISDDCLFFIEKVSAVLRPHQYVSTSLILDDMHQAVIISSNGLLAVQPQLHFCQRYQWTAIGSELNVVQLPLEQGEITIVLLTGDDANIPEIVHIAAQFHAHLLLIPFDIQSPCEMEYNLKSRALENRVCIVAASRGKAFI